MSGHEHAGITFPSEEEMHMWMWMKEAQDHGVIKQFIHQPAPYILSAAKKYDVEKQLKTKVKTVERSLMNKHVYTADFAIYTDYVMPLDKQYQNTDVIVMDVKGGYQQYDGQRAFSINQKWVYSKFGVYVHKVVPEEFFKATFVPDGARLTPKTGRVRKCYAGTRLVGDYVKILRGDDMSKKPRGIRNNNPGNIRHGDNWDGLADEQPDASFCTFTSMPYGIRALAKTLITYRDKYHLKTPEQVITRWAPPKENDTAAYVRHVENVIARKHWNMQSREAMVEYVRVICLHENGIKWAHEWMPYVSMGVDLAVE